MPTYLLKGKDRNQLERTVRIQAETGSSARSTLAAQGWTELILLRDEIMEMAARTMESPAAVQAAITPEVEAAYMEGRAPTPAQLWMKSIREFWMELAVASAILAFGIYVEVSFLIWLSSAGILFLLFHWPLLNFYFGLPLRYMLRLHKAKAWARWDEVLLCVRRLEQLRRLYRLGPGPFELARNRAQALAAKGRLDEGLAVFKAFENAPEFPFWYCLNQLSTIYSAACDYEKASELNAQVLVLNPGSSLLWLEQACLLCRRLGRLAEAQEAFSRVQAEDLPDLAQPHLQAARGLLAWRSGHLNEAKQHLEQAINALAAQSSHMPLTDYFVYFAKADLCAVLGALGERDRAAQLLKEVEPFLTAHKEVELLQSCRDGCRGSGFRVSGSKF